MLIYQDFVRQATGAMAVGIACGGISIVYQFDRPSGFAKVMIHFCVGMGVFYPTGIYLGWIPFDSDKTALMLLQFLCSCGIFVVIWLCFYLFNRTEAKKINRRLKELE